MLVFPPVTEARLFPYLSLPMLTAWLRERGHRVLPKDLNLALNHRLFQRGSFERYEQLHQEQAATSLKERYRVEMARYLGENAEALYSRVFQKSGGMRSEVSRDVRFVRQGVDLLLEGSFILEPFTSVTQIAAAVREHTQAAPADLATQAMRTLLEEAFAQGAPDVFAVSVAFFSQLLPSLLLAKWVKELSPQTLVILGGQQIMLRHEALAACEGLHAFVDGLGISAGEQTLERLLEWRAGRGSAAEVPDIVWLGAPSPGVPAPRSTLHIQQVPPPDFSDLPAHEYLQDESHLSLITCVGCYWGRCTFCSYGNRSRREGYQQKTAKQIAAECEHLVTRYGIPRINFIDENTNLRLVLHAMRLLNRQGIHIRFSVRNRLEKVLEDPGFCQELASRGCVLMSVGYETNSQRLLDKLDKGVDASAYQRIIDNLHQARITLRLSVMGGVLDETPEEQKASEEFLARNMAKIGIDVMQMLVCEPKTLLAEHAEQHGLRITSQEELRGNRLLNYGQGRMGFSFEYPDGDTFSERLERFLSLYRSVSPQGNDELPPARRSSAPKAAPRPLAGLRLYPWVKILGGAGSPAGGSGPILVDLLWQQFYRLPAAVRMGDSGTTLEAPRAEKGSEFMRQLMLAGAGEALYAAEST